MDAIEEDLADPIEEPTGRPSHRQRCLIEVWKRPGQTAAEIAAATGMRRHDPSRRLPDLRRNGLVKTGPLKTCSVTGNPSVTWFPN